MSILGHLSNATLEVGIDKGIEQERNRIREVVEGMRAASHTLLQEWAMRNQAGINDETSRGFAIALEEVLKQIEVAK